MAYAISPVLALEGEDILEVSPASTVLLRRLGLEALPAHATMTLPIERLIVAEADRLMRSAKRLVKSIQHVGILQNPSVVIQGGGDMHDLQANHTLDNLCEVQAIHALHALNDFHAAKASFEVIAGRRRVLAAGLAGLTVVKCEVYAASTVPLSALIALIENEQRSSAWVREVEALRCLMDEGVGMTLDDLATFGFDRATLAERLKIAQLPPLLLNRILAGGVSREIARKLTRLTQVQKERVAGLAAAGEEITAERVKDILRAQINAGLVPIQTELAQGWNTPSHPKAAPSHTSAPCHAAARMDPVDAATLSPQPCLTSSGCEEQAEQAESVDKEIEQEPAPEICSTASTLSQFSTLLEVLDALHTFEQSPDYKAAPRTIQTLTEALVQQLCIALRDTPPASQPTAQPVQPNQSQS